MATSVSNDKFFIKVPWKGLVFLGYYMLFPVALNDVLTLPVVTNET